MISPASSAGRRAVCVEIDKADLEAGIRTELINHGQFAVGRVRRRHSTNEIRLIVDRFRADSVIPSGNRMPALTDWAVLTCAADGQPTIEQIPALVEAARSQLVVCIRLDDSQRDRLDVLIWDRGQLLTADSIKVIGSGGFALPERPEYESFDITAERRKFLELRDSRTSGGLGKRLLSRVRPLCLALVGAGGGGSALATQIAALRPRRVLLFDPDTIGPENLNAMPHATELDAEQQVLKVEALATAIEASQPDIHVNGLPWSIAESRSSQLLETIRVDGFFSFVDSDAARLCTNHLARESHAVHVDVGTRIRWVDGQRIMQADIRLFAPGQGRGCVLCVPQMSTEHREEAFYELNAPSGSMHRGEPFAWDDPEHGRAGSLLLLNTVAASMAMDLWLAWIDGKIPTSHWLRVSWPFGQRLETELFGIVGESGCPFCGEQTSQ